jgi:hypothetical protein
MQKMGSDIQQHGHCCPVFGVESGGPIIGLSILLILFAIVPFILLPGTMPVVMSVSFVGFGIFLVWIGIAK